MVPTTFFNQSLFQTAKNIITISCLPAVHETKNKPIKATIFIKWKFWFVILTYLSSILSKAVKEYIL